MPAAGGAPRSPPMPEGLHMLRRRQIGSLAATAAALAAPLAARAQPAPGWPSRPIQIIVPAPGGGGTADTLARILAQEIETRLAQHQRVLIDNRPGANGNIGAAAAARAAPDGYTFLYSWAGTLATNPSLYRDLPFDPQRDFEPIVLVGNVPNILVVNKELGPKTLTEFTAYARSHPDQINFGSTGNGSSMHLAGALYEKATGTRMTHVPYNSPAQATNDLIAGRIQAMFQLVTGIQGQVRGGAVVPIAVLAERRDPNLPEVPTMAELGLPIEFGTWFGLLAPKRTPAPILAEMNRLVNAVLEDPAARRRLQEAGLDVLGGPPERLAQRMAEERRRHAELVRSAGIHID
jgi:tripartite-type tricarboxylate transporter receptor subunit TctC